MDFLRSTFDKICVNAVPQTSMEKEMLSSLQQMQFKCEAPTFMDI